VPDDQISPELVLVDPELGEQARADLPWAAADVPWAVARPPVPTASAAPARLERPRTGFTIAATLWLFGAVAVAVTLVVELLPDRGPRPSLAPAAARTPAPARPPAPAATPAPSAAPAEPRARKAKPPPAAVQPAAPRPQPPPTARPKPKPKPQSKPKAQSTQPPAAAKPDPQPRQPSPAAAKPKPKPKAQRRPPPAAAAPPAKRRAPPAAVQPARVFAWAPHPGASYYHVVIRRDGRLFYEAWPREARLEIPGRFRFSPGEYTWRVEPGTGARSDKQLGPPIVESSFTIEG
jgi:hypothetical protein